MAKLRQDASLSDPDGFYGKLIELHEGLSQDESNKVNAKLILMLANHIGDDEVLEEALDYLRSQRSKDRSQVRPS